MKGADRFLLAIVAGLVVLGLTTLVLVVVRPDPGYEPDDTPAGMVNNYVLALEQGDYARAYSYVDPRLLGYPRDLNTFTEDMQQYGEFDSSESATIHVEDVSQAGDHATVTVNKTVSYDSGQGGTSTFDYEVVFHLLREGDAWQLMNASEYWVLCWEAQEGCD